jgi:hypothetical protein
MAELTPDEVAALARALGVPVPAGDLAEVAHRLNALLEALAPLGGLPLAEVEPAPPGLDEPAP